MPVDPRTVSRAIAAGRVGYGLAMVVAPRALLRLQTGDEPAGPFVWLGRVFGIRDAVLGAGALLAEPGEEQRRWAVAGAVADGCDCLAALAGGKLLGRRSAAVAALVAASAAGAGAWSSRATAAR